MDGYGTTTLRCKQTQNLGRTPPRGQQTSFFLLTVAVREQVNKILGWQNLQLDEMERTLRAVRACVCLFVQVLVQQFSLNAPNMNMHACIIMILILWYHCSPSPHRDDKVLLLYKLTIIAQ